MAIIKCEFCGAEISDRAKACPYCGTNRMAGTEELKQPIYCEDCGELLTEDMEECPKCGCPVSKPEDVNSEIIPDKNELSESHGEEKRGLSKKKIIIIAVAAAAVVALAIIGLVLGLNSSKSDKDIDGNKTASSESKTTATTAAKQSYDLDNDYVGTWDAYALFDGVEKLTPVSSGSITIEIKSSGIWSMDANSIDTSASYAGTWDIETINGDEWCVFKDGSKSVALASLYEDGTIGMMFMDIEDTMVLLEKIK